MKYSKKKVNAFKFIKNSKKGSIDSAKSYDRIVGSLRQSVSMYVYVGLELLEVNKNKKNLNKRIFALFVVYFRII